MLKYPVIATHISNLTDARYFAARGIDFLLYDLDQINIDQIEEIQNWISGPKALLLFSKRTLSLIDEAIIKLNPTAIAMKEGPKDELRHIEGHTELFDWSKDEVHLDGRSFHSFDQHNGSEDMGIILMGGTEEMVGVKSYDELDEILDQLEN